MSLQQFFLSSVGRILLIGFVVFANLSLISTANATDNSAKMDFDGDGKTDLAVYHPGRRNIFPLQDSYFYILGSQTGQAITHQWGRAYDIHSPADYDGDGKTDVSVFRWLDNNLSSTESDYYTKNTSGGNKAIHFSGFGNIISRNYFGNQRAEIAVFDYHDISEDPVNPCLIAAFYIKAEGSDFPVQKDLTNTCLPARQFITPAIFDYNADGKSDICVFIQPPPASNSQNSNSVKAQDSTEKRFELWWSPVTGQYTPPDLIFNFDIDYPIPGDFDGDGIGDFAGSKNVDGSRLWRIRKSTNGEVIETIFGSSTDLPVPGDYDGDGKTDIAVFRAGIWYIKRSTDEAVVNFTFGNPSDIPLTVPNSNIYF